MMNMWHVAISASSLCFLAHVLARVLHMELNTVLLTMLIGLACACFAKLQDRKGGKR